MAQNENGIQFPKVNGERSTMETQKQIWAKTFAAIKDTETEGQVLATKNWRFGYTKFVLKHVEKALASPENAVKAAQAGLDAMHSMFEFSRDGGKTVTSFADAMAKYESAPNFHTVVVKGTGKRLSSYEVPYKGKKLSGDELVAQVRKWERYGTIESTAADAIAEVAKNNTWTDLSNRYFVLLGAGSAMGPFLVLMALGANVIAVDLDRPGIWKRLIEIARNSPGTLTFATKKPESELKTDDELFANAGANLMTQAPEIAKWLLGVYPSESLTVGCYVYLDGEMHVRVALACDGIMKLLSEKRKGTSLAFLCTPTDAHVIPEEANKAALRRWNEWSLVNLSVAPLRWFSRRMVVKNALRPIKADNGDTFYIVDGLVDNQGPNYALAKRMQHWRAIVARQAGQVVSTNIAPSTATVSVTSNRSFAWAYDGMPVFKPLEIFQQETSNAVMSAILLYDLNSANSAANPKKQLRNPYERMSFNSFNGGVWRNAFKVGSIGEVSVIVHFIKEARPFVFVALAAAVVYYAVRNFA